MKKIISLFTTLCIVFGVLGTFTVFAQDSAVKTITLSVGDYIQMGTYNNVPILWRCVAFERIKGYESDGTPITDSTDTVTEYRENYLPLMLSDKIICFKAFDAKTNVNSEVGFNSETGSHSRRKLPQTTNSNYWADSNIRSWLNSSADAGEVIWACGNPPHQDDWNNMLWGGYENEAGFLTNFSEEERSIIKEVSQKSIVAGSDKDLEGVTGSALHKYEFDMSEIVQNYNEAYSEQVKDIIFLPDVKQIDTVYKNGATLGADYFIPYPTKEAAEVARSFGVSTIGGVEQWSYMLRTPYCADSNKNDTSIRKVCNANGGYVGSSSASFGSTGVRPAFFLDLSKAIFESGDGTENSPYIATSRSIDNVIEISTLAELEQFRDDVNSGNTYEGKTVKLTADIDMSEKYGENKESWTSIGIDNLTYFGGTFDGCFHKITGLYTNSRGLFGENRGTIQNVSVSGKIICQDSAGGIVGENTGKISRCSFSGSITGESHIGGITGMNIAMDEGTGIFDCYNTATVTSNSGVVGGIAGLTTRIERCYNIGSVSANDMFASIGVGDGPITDCYYLIGTADKGTEPDTFNTTALTAEQLEDKTNFANWDFDTVWKMDETLGRPVLRSGTEEPPIVPHTHTLVHHAAVPATCTENGTGEYWKCEGTGACDKMFSDANGTEEITEIPVIPAKEHNWGAWNITVEPTDYEPGYAERICKNDSEHNDFAFLPVLKNDTVWTAGARVEPTETTDGSQDYNSIYGTVTVILPATGNKYDYSIKYENEKAVITVPKDGTYTVIFAAYDNDGRLLSVNAQNIQLVKGENSPISPQNFNASEKIKIMLWDSLTGMKPLCAADGD